MQRTGDQPAHEGAGDDAGKDADAQALPAIALRGAQVIGLAQLLFVHEDVAVLLRNLCLGEILQRNFGHSRFLE